MVVTEFLRSHHLENMSVSKIQQGFQLMVRIMHNPDIPFSEIENIASEVPIYWTRKVYSAAIYLRAALTKLQVSHK